jgi:hypothetical protein
MKKNWRVITPFRFKYLESVIFIEQFSRQIGFSIYLYNYAIQFEFSCLWVNAFLTIGHIK